MKMARKKNVPEGYEYAERKTCAFGDILYASPSGSDDINTADAKILLFMITPLKAAMTFGQGINPTVNDDCWMTVDIGHPFGHRAIVVGPKTHWLKRKE